MGQKICPTSFRSIRRKNWGSLWYANKKEFGDLLCEDQKIRNWLMRRACCAGTSRITIRRMADKIEVTIFTARPGLVIGKKGAEIDILKQDLKRMTGKEVWIEVEEAKRPDLEAVLLADGVAKQLERRIPFRRAMKKAMQAAIDAGAVGVKVRVSGRLGGAEIARAEWYKRGSVPLHTIRADIDYGTARAETTYGAIGVKVWVNRGDEMYASKGA